VRVAVLLSEHTKGFSFCLARFAKLILYHLYPLLFLFDIQTLFFVDMTEKVQGVHQATEGETEVGNSALRKTRRRALIAIIIALGNSPRCDINISRIEIQQAVEVGVTCRSARSELEETRLSGNEGVEFNKERQRKTVCGGEGLKQLVLGHIRARRLLLFCLDKNMHGEQKSIY